nr:MAG TPA: hypothetical protein [Caudoviricetes sp.]
MIVIFFDFFGNICHAMENEHFEYKFHDFRVGFVMELKSPRTIWGIFVIVNVAYLTGVIFVW